MISGNRTTYEIDGVGEIRIHHAEHDIIVFLDEDRDAIVVDDATEWIRERRPETDGGGSVFDGTCPMCGEPYDSYTYHLRDCEP